MPYYARAAEIVARWRVVARQFESEENPETSAALSLELAQLRRSYQFVVQAAHADHKLIPPFPY